MLVALISTGVVLLAFIGFGLYGLLADNTETTQSVDTAVTPSTEPAAVVPAARIEAPRPVLETTEADRFARDVARALFTWDTRSSDGLVTWQQPLVDAADHDEAAGLAADIRDYLPSTDMWAQLREYGTRQWLEIDTVTEPAAWRTAVAQAATGQIPRGAAAFTITGTRHREGIWNTEPQHSSRPVAFTVFVVCPADDPCALLRLSRLDAPLE
ncbi:hypothetical protein GB864_17050 [Agromyces sp. MMS17-SY077]|uniref:Uncharacterized protein n=1 Tax=Agromyces seonyuensis TaxID=2662446 RepID=A0A6I4P6K3_9MICO|nr:hypothetical protein [Agromyces seonyuensis]